MVSTRAHGPWTGGGLCDLVSSGMSRVGRLARKIARNVRVDRIRQRNASPEMTPWDEDIEAPGAPSSTTDAFAERCREVAARAGPSGRRVAAALRDGGITSREELADRLGMSERQVRRVLARLRRIDAGAGR